MIGNSRINLKNKRGQDQIYVPVRNRDRIGQNFSIEDYNFERARQFKYLGTNISENNEITEEINNRIQAGNRCLFAL